MEFIFRDIDDIITLHSEEAIVSAQSIGHTFATTDFVLDSYGDCDHPVNFLIKSSLVSLITFTDSELTEIQKIYLKHRDSLSITDCSVIFYAISTNGVLVSNQRIIINIGELYKVKTYTMMMYFQEVKPYKTG